MDNDTIFLLINLAVVPAWLLLILAPRSVVTWRVVHAALYPLIFGLIYCYYLIGGIVYGATPEGAGMTSIDGVMMIFSTDAGVLTGWVHYLVFDLFVGAWIARNALKRDVSRFVVIPSLILTFVFGPIGLLLYLVLRMATGRGGWELE